MSSGVVVLVRPVTSDLRDVRDGAELVIEQGTPQSMCVHAVHVHMQWGICRSYSPAYSMTATRPHAVY